MAFDQTLRECGVVGAGGAGFPTCVKATAEVEFVLAGGFFFEWMVADNRQNRRDTRQLLQRQHFLSFFAIVKCPPWAWGYSTNETGWQSSPRLNRQICVIL